MTKRPKTQEEVDTMRQVPYASAVGSLMYAMLCTRPDICYSVGMVSQYQSNPRPKHWQAVKHILKYLRRTRAYMLVYRCEDLIPIGHFGIINLPHIFLPCRMALLTKHLLQT